MFGAGIVACTTHRPEDVKVHAQEIQWYTRQAVLRLEYVFSDVDECGKAAGFACGSIKEGFSLHAELLERRGGRFAQ